MTRLTLIACLLALGGCATGATTGAKSSSTAASAQPEMGAEARLDRMAALARQSQERIQELEARVALLEQEARAMRESGRVKPTETVRIGEERRARAAKRREPEPKPREAPRTVIRLHNTGPARNPEPLVLPEPPPGVPSRLPVAPLPGARAADLATAGPAASDPRAAYREALGLVRARDYGAALEKLDAFLATHADHSLSDNAMYWRGEVHYARRDYQRALVEFQGVLSRYPNTNKAADATLKIGLCHLRLGDEAQAARHFERVRKQYPDSDAARIASREGSS